MYFRSHSLYFKPPLFRISRLRSEPASVGSYFSFARCPSKRVYKQSSFYRLRCEPFQTKETLSRHCVLVNYDYLAIVDEGGDVSQVVQGRHVGHVAESHGRGLINGASRCRGSVAHMRRTPRAASRVVPLRAAPHYAALIHLHHHMTIHATR